MTKTPKTPEQRSERRSRLIVSKDNGRFILRLRDIEALDHSDICLLKSWITSQDKGVKVTINLKGVQYLPSGFFGMLYEIVEYGINLSLSDLTEPINQQLWVKQFINNKGVFVIPKKAWVPTRD